MDIQLQLLKKKASGFYFCYRPDEKQITELIDLAEQFATTKLDRETTQKLWAIFVRFEAFLVKQNDKKELMDRLKSARKSFCSFSSNQRQREQICAQSKIIESDCCDQNCKNDFLFLRDCKTRSSDISKRIDDLKIFLESYDDILKDYSTCVWSLFVKFESRVPSDSKEATLLANMRRNYHYFTNKQKTLLTARSNRSWTQYATNNNDNNDNSDYDDYSGDYVYD